MRYAKNESTFILGNFTSGDTVTIDVYRLSDDSKVVDGATCGEIGSTGVFKYNFSQSITEKTEYLWIMTNGDIDQRGKIVLGGYMDDLATKIQDIVNIEYGRWKIENNQMIFYAPDNTTEVARFNLYDSTGQPSMFEVFERVKQ